MNPSPENSQLLGYSHSQKIGRLPSETSNGQTMGLLSKFFSNALCAARDDGDFVVEIHIYTPLKILFRGKFVLRNEYLLESVQAVLFRIVAKIVIFRELSAQSAPIIPVFQQ